MIIAPGVADGAARLVKRKKNVRLLVCGVEIQNPSIGSNLNDVNGGLLVQDADLLTRGTRVVTRRSPVNRR